MASIDSQLETQYNIISLEDGSIDQNRIVDGHLLPDEYFCPICRCLLWNPRSCSSCKHLFCQKCIHTWMKYVKSDQQCPFRCQSYEEQCCPPLFQSLLSRLTIQCRNFSFGCSELLSYDSLEQHENIDCKFLTKMCSECLKMILVSKFNEHIQISGNCVPCPKQCTICKSFIEKSNISNHFKECTMTRLRTMFVELARSQSTVTTQEEVLLLTTENQSTPLLQKALNGFIWLDEQRQNLGLPTNLVDTNRVQQAREQGCSNLYHIFLMLTFILNNWKNAPYLLWAISSSGFIEIITFVVKIYSLCLHCVARYTYESISLVILYCYLLNLSILYIFEFVSDQWIMLTLMFIIVLFGCSIRGSLQVLEVGATRHSNIGSMMLYCFVILIMKLLLIFLRFFFCSLSSYLTTSILEFLHIFIIFYLRDFNNVNNISN